MYKTSRISTIQLYFHIPWITISTRMANTLNLYLLLWPLSNYSLHYLQLKIVCHELWWLSDKMCHKIDSCFPHFLTIWFRHVCNNCVSVRCRLSLFYRLFIQHSKSRITKLQTTNNRPNGRLIGEHIWAQNNSVQLTEYKIKQKNILSSVYFGARAGVNFEVFWLSCFGFTKKNETKIREKKNPNFLHSDDDNDDETHQFETNLNIR